MPEQQNLQFEYVDPPHISEIFADSLERIRFDGQALRLEFCVTRTDEPKANQPIGGKKYTACRLVLPPNGLIELFDKLNAMISALEQQGLLKRNTVPAAEPPNGGKLN